MASFNFLHFSDLHWGCRWDQEDHWETISEKLIEDVDCIMDKAKIPHWHVVFFTGDLVYSGRQFEALTPCLERLWKGLSKDKKIPQLICVPGNHDLVWPENREEVEIVPEDVWQRKSETSSFKTVQSIFNNYSQWVRELPSDIPVVKPNGKEIIPGEFVHEIDIENYKIGIVGLNSAFGDLNEGDDEKLPIHQRQLRSLCGNIKNWFEGKHVSLLLTHHPPQCFAENYSEEYFTHIAPVSRFALHLCGHMHHNDATALNIGGGNEFRRIVQGSSLFGDREFGLRTLEGKKVPADRTRSFGYWAGKVEFFERYATYRGWPRIGEVKDNKVFSFNRDQGKNIKEDEGTMPVEVSRYESPISFSPSKVRSPSKIIVEGIQLLLDQDKTGLKNALLAYLIERNIVEENETDGANIIKKMLSLEIGEFVIVVNHAIFRARDTLDKNQQTKENLKKIWEKAEQLLGFYLMSIARLPSEQYFKRKYAYKLEARDKLEGIVSADTVFSLDVGDGPYLSLKYQENKIHSLQALRDVAPKRWLNPGPIKEYGVIEVLKEICGRLGLSTTLIEEMQDDADRLANCINRKIKHLKKAYAPKYYYGIFFPDKTIPHEVIEGVKKKLRQLQIFEIQLGKDTDLFDKPAVVVDEITSFLDHKAHFYKI